MPTTKTTDNAEWLSAAELVALTGLSVAEVRHLRESFARGAVRGKTGGQRTHAPTLFRGWHEDWKAAKLGRNTDAAAAHARWKLAQAERQELALARERNESLDREEVFSMLEVVGGAIRQAGERIMSRFGREAGEILIEALEQSYDEFERRFD